MTHHHNYHYNYHYNYQDNRTTYLPVCAADLHSAQLLHLSIWKQLGGRMQQEVIMPVSQLRELLITDVHFSSKIHSFRVQDITTKGQVQVFQLWTVPAQCLNGHIRDETTVGHVHSSQFSASLRDGHQTDIRELDAIGDSQSLQ